MLEWSPALCAAWLNSIACARSRLEVFWGNGGIQHFSSFLSITLPHARIEIHVSGCYHTIVWGKEYCHVRLDGSCKLVRAGEDFISSENVTKSYVFASRDRTCPFAHLWIVPTGNTAIVHYFKVVFKWSIVAIVKWRGIEHSRFPLFSSKYSCFLYLYQEESFSWASTFYGTSTLARACLMVGSAGNIRLG